MDLFSVTCTTCRAKLRVRNEAAIGQILACPKCESMVLIVPPPDWNSPSAESAAESRPEAAAAPATAAAPKFSEPAGGVDLSAPPADLTLPEPSAEEMASPAGTAVAPVPPPPPELAANWASPTERAAQKILLWSVLGGVGLFVLGGSAVYLFSGDDAPPPVAAAQDDEKPSPKTPAKVPAPEEEPQKEEAPEEPSEPEPKQSSATAVDGTAKQSTPPAMNDPSAPGEGAPEPDKTLPPRGSGSRRTSGGNAGEAGSPATSATEKEPAGAAFTPAGESPFSSFDEPLENVDPALAVSNRANESPLAPTTEGGAPDGEPIERMIAEEKTATPAPDTTVARRLPASEGAPPLDAQARLRDPVKGLQLTAPLGDFARFLTDLTTLPISLDLPALRAAGVNSATPVTASQQDSTVAEVLATALADRHLTYLTEGNQIVVTSGAPAREVFLRIEDLVGDDLRATQEFARLTQTLVAPRSWRAAGGKGTVRVEPGAMTVEQSPAVIYDLVIFCERLRVARELAPRSHVDPRLFALTTKLDQAAAALQQPVMFTFHEPTHLQRVTRYLEAQTGVKLLIDWRSLARDEFTPATQITCAIEKRPLADALTAVLAPLDLSWRVVDAKTLEIFSRQDASKAQREFYPIKQLLAAGARPEAVLAAVRRGMSDKLWQSGGGPGVLHYDPAGQCLIVYHLQGVQAEVARLLAALGKKLAAGR